MHGEGISTHSNTRSWKCWLQKDKLWGNKSQILLSTCIFSQRNLKLSVATWGTLGGIHLSAEHQSKLYSLKRALKRDGSAGMLPSDEGHLSGLKSTMNASLQVSPAMQKNSGMNQILLQCRAVTNPCPCGYAPIPMASVRADWECREGNRCLWGPAKLSFLLAKRNCISRGCVLGVTAGTWGVRWILMSIPQLRAQEAAKITLPLLARALQGHCTKTSEVCRYSDKERHKSTLWRHSPRGAIILVMFLKLCKTREEMEEISPSNSPVVGMLNCRNEGNRSTPATVGGSRQIRRIWPDPSLPLTPTLREPVSFVVWWKIYTVKQIRA